MNLNFILEYYYASLAELNEQITKKPDSKQTLKWFLKTYKALHADITDIYAKNQELHNSSSITCLDISAKILEAIPIIKNKQQYLTISNLYLTQLQQLLPRHMTSPLPAAICS